MKKSFSRKLGYNFCQLRRVFLLPKLSLTDKKNPFMHRKAVEKLLKESAFAYKATGLPMIVLSVIAALWTVLALAGHFPREASLQVGVGLYLFAGIGVWSRAVAAKRYNEALCLYAAVEHLGDLPLTESCLAD